MKPRIRYFESVGVYKATLTHRGQPIVGYGLSMRDAFNRAVVLKQRLDRLYYLHAFGGDL